MTEIRLIAPCGINCTVCRGHLRKKNPCPGCRASDVGKPITRLRCKMKTCEKSGSGEEKFCFQCDELPCKELARLDKRYRVKYFARPVENLRNIQEGGITKFLEDEAEKWKCADCGGWVSMHTGRCARCEKTKNFEGQS